MIRRSLGAASRPPWRRTGTKPRARAGAAREAQARVCGPAILAEVSASSSASALSRVQAAQIRHLGSARTTSVARGGRNAAWVQDLAKEIEALSSPRGLLAFFVEHSDHLWPGHLCALLEGLAAGGLSTSELASSKEFMRLMNDVVWKLDRFGAAELPRLLAALSALQWHDRDLFKIAEPLTLRHLPKMEAQNLPQVVAAYVRVQCGGRALFDQVWRQCSEVLWDFEAASLAALAQAFSQSPHKPKAVLVAMSPCIVAHLPSFGDSDLLRVVEAYALWPRDVSEELVRGLLQLLREDEGRRLLVRLAPAQHLLLLRALALWRSRARFSRDGAGAGAGRGRGLWRGWPSALLPWTMPALLDRRSRLGPEELATAVWALARAEAPSPALSSLCSRLAPDVQRVSGPGLAAALLAAARSAAGITSACRGKGAGSAGAAGAGAAQRMVPSEDNMEAEEVDEVEDTSQGSGRGQGQQGSCSLEGRSQLLRRAEGRAQELAPEMPPRELASVVTAYCLAQEGSPELLALLQKLCTRRCREFAVEQLASLSWSFATLRGGLPFFKEAQFDLLERLSQLAPAAVCDILWSYSVVRLREPQLFRALLALLAPSEVTEKRSCALLCPAILDIRSSLPDMDPEGMERYLGYTRAAFHQTQLSLAPPRSSLESVAAALASLGLADDEEPEDFMDVDGYVVDICLKSCQRGAGTGRPVALLYHRPGKTLHLQSEEPLGQAIMRHRHLQQRGFDCINLNGRLWERMSGEEQQSFLGAKLRGR